MTKTYNHLARKWQKLQLFGKTTSAWLRTSNSTKHCTHFHKCPPWCWKRFMCSGASTRFMYSDVQKDLFTLMFKKIYVFCLLFFQLDPRDPHCYAKDWRTTQKNVCNKIPAAIITLIKESLSKRVKFGRNPSADK